MSYRRSDSAGEAGRLSDDLVACFGRQSVFMDVETIQPGRDFRKAIQESVGGCQVLLAIIGPTWLETRDNAGDLRLNSEADYVRLEIATALHRDISVIPVLVRGARMPNADELPESIRDLAYRNAVELTHARWKSDVQVMIRSIAPCMDEPVIQTQSGSAATTPASPSASASGLDGAVIGRVSVELAAYIGPIAELVVKRAARRCTTALELYELVAKEIEAGGDRSRFLASRNR